MTSAQKIPAKIYVVEDESTIARFVADALEIEGYEVRIASTLREGMRAARTERPDLLIVDLGLPDGDGIDLIESTRVFSSAPIIVLSARNGETAKIRALDAGADDYLIKPFSLAELLARVRAQMRRRRFLSGGMPNRLARIGEVEVDLESRTVSKRAAPVHLTKLEYRLLAALIESRGKVLTQRQLLQTVWGPAYVDRPHYLRIYMAHLRTKLEDDPARPQWLITETGVGYRLAVED